jgi:hypothetical protein
MPKSAVERLAERFMSEMEESCLQGGCWQEFLAEREENWVFCMAEAQEYADAIIEEATCNLSR